MSPFDLVLIVVGALLTLVGVYLFASGKMADRASKVEAFGIKLDVTNPSLILVFVGVGLMLAPRLMPGAAVPEPERKVAVAPPPPAATAATPPATPAAATAAVPPQRAHTKARPAPETRPEKRIAVASTSSQPAAMGLPRQPPTTVSAVTPAPIAAPAAPEAAGPQPTPTQVTKIEMAPTAAGPAYLVAALGSPDRWKRFWAGEDEAGYSLKLARRSAERLHRAARTAKVEVVSDRSGVTTLMSGNTPRQRRCEAGGLTGLAVLTVAPPTVAVSTVESAHWPELTLLLHDCKDGTARRQVWQLSPRGSDRFPFEGELVEDLDQAFRDQL